MNISVVMATYNGAKYLQEQLDTIKNQTISPDEVIICDDCSADNTVEIVKNYIRLNHLEEKWKVFQNDYNLGYANNFNKAAELASGQFLFFADQDDIWLDNKIEISLKIMEKHQDCQVLCSDYEPFVDGKNVSKPPKSIIKQMPNNGMLEKVELDKKSVYIRALGCCMCVRKIFFQSVQKYWFEGWAQDDRMWRLSQCVDGCYLLHSNLVRHRIHNNNTSTYGNYHSIDKRIKLFCAMQKANCQMLQMLKDGEDNSSKIVVIDKHIKMMNLRIELLKKKNLWNSISLIAFLPYYQKSKSLLLEAYLVVKRR